MNRNKLETQKLIEEQIKEAPDKDYMNEEQLAFFKELLIELHESTRKRVQEFKDHISSPMELSDESDRATWEEQCAISLRIVDREQKLLPKIRQALERIRLGDYGYCQESGEPIGIQRLLVRPTAEYCVDIKTLKEIKEHFYRD
ncbi:MAG: RNA polymerase-binding protein DksA [Oleispira sp.]|nr:RNA polymerase-binding protein DksA [Oleispira sp.]